MGLGELQIFCITELDLLRLFPTKFFCVAKPNVVSRNLRNAGTITECNPCLSRVEQ